MPRRVLVVLLVLGACAGSAAATSSPVVIVTSTRPVVVAGRGFVAGERVRVVVHTAQTRTRTVVATRTGRFVARYAIAVGDCTAIRVTAKGNRGSRASYAIAPVCEPSESS